MDFAHSPESFYAPDFAKGTFAASPNSLYMYDQERNDMQNTLNSGILTQIYPNSDVATLGAESEFDLNPQYENSDSLEGYFGGLPSSTPGGGMNSLSAVTSEKQDLNKVLGFLENTQEDLKQGGPTLAELNMDPYLFEDIYSIIGEDEKLQASGGVELSAGDVKKPATVTSSTRTETSPKTYTSLSPFCRTQAQVVAPSQTQTHPPPPSVSNLFGIKPQNVAVVPPISVTPTPIKTEPMDTYESFEGAKSCLHKMLSSPPLKPLSSTTLPAPTSYSSRQIMPVVGKSRTPAPGQELVKTESMEEKWKEIEKFIHDPELHASRKRKRNASGGSAIMSDEEDCKPDLGNLSDYDDSDSDVDSDYSDTPFDESLTELAKKSKQYFWQYNVQSKGPKGTRLKLNLANDPHHPSNFEDPVFDATSTSLVGIRHGGKARKGDGNEISPNPKKLCQLGHQLYKLNRQINSCQVSNDLPASIRNKSRKEKNKLASRACRLKKKAQHEANKIKLTGLDTEQNELLEVVRLMWPQLKERAQQRMKGDVSSPDTTHTLSSSLDHIIMSHHKTAIAGNTTDFVNDVISKVEEGDPAGGLLITPKVRK